MSEGGISVLKFGSSILRTEEDLPTVAEEVRFWLKGGGRVIAVVSAFGDTTEKLFERCRRYGDPSNEEALAALVATGEQGSAALVALALSKAGIEARVLDPVEIELRAYGVPLDARLSGVNTEVIREALTECRAVVIPGFIARTSRGSSTLLERGGSDLTALFLAHALSARRCRLIKDVDGLYESDPKAGEADHPKRYEYLGWDEALALESGVIQQKALMFAADNKLSFEVTALGGASGTWVGEKRA